MFERRGTPRFADRRDAGRQLGAALAPVLACVPAADPVGRLLVLGLPRGGVVVAAETARILGADLDVLVVRKVADPARPELALGAISAHGQTRNEPLLHRRGVTAEEFDRLAAAQCREVADRERRYRAGRPPLALQGRDVLLVDDGLATGATAQAAISAVTGARPRWLGLAVPVGAPTAIAALASQVDELVAPLAPASFSSVSRYYDVFPQTSDEEVLEILADYRTESS